MVLAASSAPAIVSSSQRAHNISTNNGSVFLAGGNVTVQNQYFDNHQQSKPRTIDMAEVLRMVSNLRKVYLDILSKATPGTAIWILKTDYFSLWLDPNGDLKVLWGSGIRKTSNLYSSSGC